VTTLTHAHEHQWTPPDGTLQVKRPTLQRGDGWTWLRDEEANASGENLSGGSLTELP
jgi:hypothetical protein